MIRYPSAQRLNVLEICPYEPPVSRWTTRIKLLRRMIRARGGKCEILDIGPSRKLARPDCIAVMHVWDYLLKVLQFSRQRFTIHCHINAEYFRGLLLALVACLIARMFRNRCLVTFHAGTDQPFLKGGKRRVIGPIFRIIFSLAHAIICNGNIEKKALLLFQKESKIFAIPAFSQQYLEYEETQPSSNIEYFLKDKTPLVLTYLCFRDGFFTDVVIDGIATLVSIYPQLGLVIVGTGDGVVETREQITTRQLESNVYLAGDLRRDDFMTLLSRSDIYLRSPISDGVSASVLEALSLCTPVVASDNGTRPPTVITYNATDHHELAQNLHWVIEHYNEVVASLQLPVIADTAQTEVDLILGISINTL